MIENLSILPRNWERATLEDVADITAGNPAPQGATYFERGSYNFVRVQDMGRLKNKVYLHDTADYINDKAAITMKLFPKGSVLFTKSGMSILLNQRAILGKAMYVVSHIGICIPLGNIPSEWLYYWLRIVDFTELTHATTLPSLKLSKVQNLIINIPPLPEQHRIVAKIEELFSELDKGVENLKTAREQLKVYRQAVLKHAFEGKLTEQWRKEHPAEIEPAETLLKKIKAEREKRYQQQLAVWQKATKAGKRVAKPVKPKELPPLTEGELAELPKLPEGWGWENLENIVWKIGDVDHRMPMGQDRGIPYISTKDFKENNCIDFEKAKLISHNDYEKLSLKIKPRYYDLLLSRYGTVGEIRKVTTDIEFQASYSIAIINTICLRGLVDYLFFCLQSEVVQSQIRGYVRATAQPDLGLAHIKILRIPIPPENEQKEIIQQIESRFSILDKLEQTIDESLQQAEALRQSILKKAFEGKLVLQDPNDEPAGVLLERITAEKANHGKKTFRKKNTGA